MPAPSDPSPASLFVTIVLDGVGIGAQPDADRYGDAGSNTLGHVCAVARPHLPHLTALGLGHIAPLAGVPAVPTPQAHFGRMQEVSAGKDSTTGHWELAGLHLTRPFPTYPEGFPDDLIRSFLEATGCPGVLGNRPASGTAIIAELGARHLETGYPIVYTSADSVFQIAAHKDVIPLDELYRLCAVTRERVCVGEHAVGRVIARPFVGTPGAFERVSGERKDFALPPPRPPLQERLRRHGVHTVAVGKIGDLFAGVGFDALHKTRTNAEGLAITLAQIRAAGERPTFLWTNLVDFDQEYGHRNDPAGFAAALEAFDAALPALLAHLPEAACLLITADHGNDPTTPGTDHTREYVPVLLVHGAPPGEPLGTRRTFADHAATVADYFGAPTLPMGTSFLPRRS
ncbi:MAG: phosphopentomutase [Bacteroidetes bacterium]|nr:MAG: phosphopentomutase [Bacteroidota bacterium]